MDRATGTSHAPRELEEAVRRLEQDQRLDRLVDALRPIAERIGAGPQGQALRGEWLGHALHPLLTDFPLGCWLSAGLLDVVGGKRSRRAAQRLVGLGVLFVPITAASGMADYTTIGDQRSRRIGAVHATGNTAVALCYVQSWRARRKGRHVVGRLWGFTGGGLAWVTGYLGGHLSFGRGVGQGLRGLDVDAPAATRPSPAERDTPAATEALDPAFR